MDNVQKAKKIIEENIYMTVATASSNGEPWISPVFFAYDENYNLFWVSNKNSRHSTLLGENPKAMIVIFNSQATEKEGDGVYFEVDVEELDDIDEIEKVKEIFDKRANQDEFKVKSSDRVTGDAPWRIYKAVPYKVSKLTEGENINGQYVDKRVEIDLSTENE